MDTSDGILREDELVYIQLIGYGGAAEAQWGRTPVWGIPQNFMDTLGFEPSLQAEGRVRTPDARLKGNFSSEVG